MKGGGHKAIAVFKVTKEIVCLEIHWVVFLFVDEANAERHVFCLSLPGIRLLQGVVLEGQWPHLRRGRHLQVRTVGFLGMAFRLR